MKLAARAIALVSIILAFGSGASAQQEQASSDDPSESARFRWGPLRFTPGIALTDVGVDNNVFNEAENPKQDSTAAIGPVISVWTNLGRVRVSEKSAGQYLYFKEFDNQRSWNTANELTLELPLARLKPFASGKYVNTRQRPGFEIDSRARASTNTVTLGSNVVLSGKTMLVLSVTRSNLAFDENETFFGAELAQALNRRTDTEALQLRYTLTPLSTFVVTTDAIQDRFVNDRLRNTDSISVRPGFEFKPFALISGSVSVGFRHFNVLNDIVPDYNGVIAAVDAKYELSTSTQLSATVTRNVDFSFDDTTPYYTLTDAGLMIDQRIRSSWDVRLSGSLQSLSYQGTTLAKTNTGSRVDKGQVLSAGVGYLVGETFRIGVAFYYYARQSQLSQRNYDGLRAGASVSYGTPQ